eukprot:CAMPEP_0197691988 /NCGR_PEP_ID=MMETSP1338-20131121/110486_1 /TAXON_ID=43686 ORGANISM="Pelagodinium beii, Strain RCC1491" /NCGR_SAMPLE_ID=MMETSP1338 /ASSEMBLY_ACC=CAM_ASM_000754 /LENGTH=71 /DNA_ID=CAMNT_0043274597 /DNA_START=30 /DNA_END=243 /DNA_ORIENTATION=+
MASASKAASTTSDAAASSTKSRKELWTKRPLPNVAGALLLMLAESAWAAERNCCSEASGAKVDAGNSAESP